ncbi:MAG TPA: flippase [Roseiflexaceae bacterium]|mgnify:CR=1 FL=1|nr:flippase [Roseiflexaceae bacterium]HMP39252.1 flippase [Roseiflexaceae bacterium]
MHDSITPPINEEETPAPRSLARIVLRNTLAVLAGGLVMRLLNFIFMIFTTRLLGEVGLGKYATVVAFVGVFGVFFELGLAQYVERSVAQDRKRTQSLFWNLVLMRLILAIAAVVIVPSIALVSGNDDDVVFGIFLYSLTFVLAAFLMPLSTVLSANERFDLVTSIQVLNQIVTIVVGVILLLSGLGFLALLYTGFVAMPLQIMFCIWAIRRYRLGPLKFQVNPRSWGEFIRASIPFGITSLALNFNYNADTIILGMFHDHSEVGWYNSAYRLIFTLSAIAGAFLTVITPSLARENMTDPEKVRSWTRASIQAMAVPSLPLAVGVMLLATPIVVLLYGESFAPAGIMLAIVCWDTPLFLFNSLAGNITAAVGLERPAARIYLLSAVLNIVLNLIFIPFWGGVAAAVITLTTDAISGYMFYRLLAPQMDLKRILPSLLRAMVAALIMGVAVFFSLPLLDLTIGLPLVVAIGVLCYAALLLPLRVIEPALLRSAIARVRQRLP